MPKDVRIRECAAVFDQLRDVEYEVAVGKKNKMHEFKVTFKESDFHHLAGLQKLSDNSMLHSGRRDQILARILDGDITDDVLRRSAFYDEIETRLWVLQNIETIFDSDEAVFFQFLDSVCKGSRMQADWLLTAPLGETCAYVFLRYRQSTKSMEVACCSLFPRTRRDFTKGQPRHTVLKKVKHKVSTGERTVLYSRGSR